jgi:S-disulfanyl-L-cysteine oxidoreductase SoxD
MAKLPMVCRRLAWSLTCIRLSGIAVTFSLAVSFGAAVLAQQPRPQPSPSGLGRAATQAELRAWDISVGPSGAELPPGSGNASQGALVFTQRGCSDCHGPTGKEGPALVLVGGTVTTGSNYYPIAFWPFAPPIWDYIHRAMPYNRPGRLTADETYSLVAFLLFKNGIIQEEDVMDAKSLPRVQMPHRAAYKGPAAWTPDTPRPFKILP